MTSFKETLDPQGNTDRAKRITPQDIRLIEKLAEEAELGLINAIGLDAFDDRYKSHLIAPKH